MISFREFLSINRRKLVKDEIAERWQTRIVANGLHDMGLKGVDKYLMSFGIGIGASKCVQFALQAEREGYEEMAIGFWLKAYELETGSSVDPSEYESLSFIAEKKYFQEIKDNNMMDTPSRLIEISEQIKNGKSPQRETVRTILGWFEIPRRSMWATEKVRNAFNKAGLYTEPDFEYSYLDGLVKFLPIPTNEPESSSKEIDHKKSGSGVQITPTEITTLLAPSTTQFMDPTYRIGKLASANKTPISVKLGMKLEEAISKMMINDFSQLPVIESEREVKGVISWKSIGRRLALGKPCAYVKDCMDKHHEISADISLFAAIDSIVANEYVLIRDSNKKISGIVTTTDLSLQFRQLGEPFLLLGEIENHIRRLIHDKFTVVDFQTVKDPLDKKRKITSSFDLTFGEYIVLLQKPKNWSKLKLMIDRNIFISKLDEIRRIRNDVMHFDPDGVAESDLAMLQDFVRFLQDLISLGVV